MDTSSAAEGQYTITQVGSSVRLDGPSGSTQTINTATIASGTHGNGDAYFNPGSYTLNFATLGVEVDFSVSGEQVKDGSHLAGILQGDLFGGPQSQFYVGGGSDGIDVQVGEADTVDNRITVNEQNLSATSLGLSGISNSTAISSAAVAQGYLATMDTALETISTFRSNLGASQNRFESTLRNLSTHTQNLAHARSRIIDADFAHQSAMLAKHQILTQSGTAVLGQANSMNALAAQLLG